MIDKKHVDKVNRLADLLVEINSGKLEKDYKLSYELAREVFLKELDELEEDLKSLKEQF